MSQHDNATHEELFRRLQETEARLSLAVQSSGAGTWRWDVVSNLVIWDGRPHPVFGDRKECFEGTLRDFESALHPEDREWVLACVENALAGGNEVDFEYRVIWPDGSLHFVSDRGKVLRNDIGLPICMTGVCWDITKHKHIAEALSKSEARYRSLYTKTPIMLHSIDRQGRLISVSDCWLEKLGYRREEVIGKKSIDFLTEASRQFAIEESLPQFFQNGFCNEVPFQFVKKNGEVLDIELSATVERNEHGEIICSLGVLVDVTKRKQAEAAIQRHQSQLEQQIAQRTGALQKAKEQAEMAANAKSEFLANMSHEIRTPLNVIIGLTQSLLNRSPNLGLPEEVQEYLSHIKTNGQNLSELINNVLDLSKIEAGRMDLTLSPFNLQKLVEDLVVTYSLYAEQRGVRFTYEVLPQVPRDIVSDRGKLRQVFANLIGNAIKFTPPNKSVSFQVGLLEDNLLRFTVQDEGIGIPIEKQQRIFDAFEQVDRTLTRHFEGTGLGLAITKKLTDLMGGTISIQSRVDEGSSFSITLPFTETHSIVEESSKPSSQTFHFSSDNLVVVVEDNQINQITIKSLFRDAGIPIQLASTGEEGLQKILSFQAQGILPDLVLMDLHMPQMSGFEATQAIRALPELRHIPIVALSADAFTEQQARAYEVGMNGYLTKPIDFQELLGVLKHYLRWVIE